MNAAELFAALSALPGARAARAGGRDILESKLVGSVEVARTAIGDERGLRRIWRERANGGPVPLLLVVDDAGAAGSLRALGPVDAGGPVRAVAGDDLLRVLERLPSLSSLMAVRELAEELARLDRTGVAGVVVKGLGTEHLLASRIRDGARWGRMRELADQLDGDWREILTGLGYQLERRRTRGWVARSEGRPVLVIWPLADAGALTRLDPDGRPPEGVLLNACLEEGAAYGLLASRARLRLFEADPVAGSAVARYLELDAGSIAPDDRALLALLAPEFLAGGGFAELMEEARRFGAGLRERLDRGIRQQVLPVLGRELGRWAQSEGWDLDDELERTDLEAAALTFVFRALFLLYAESAGHLPVAQEAYAPHAFSKIVADADEGRDRLGARSTSLWRRIGILVDAMRTGDPAMAIPPYNGALFAADGFEGAAVLERATVPDAALGPALVALGIDPETGTGMDYSGLAIGHLGHIYEGLLSLRLSVADRHFSYDARVDRYVPVEAGTAELVPGELLWLTDEGGRKGGGVYYTPEALVRHLVRTAVMPAFEEHLERVAELDDPAAAARRLFEFRVLDPACGSAHFLVVVVDELADRVARFLADTPLPAVQAQLDELRAGAGETFGVRIEDIALLRRLVLKRCIYGVDLSAMGAEIAKVSLWLASFVPGLALSYLDHNVRVGNSLIGVASADQVRDAGEAAGQVGLVGQLVRDRVGAGAKAAARLFEISDRTPDEVEQSERAEHEAQAEVAGARRLLDLWVAGALGLDGARGELQQRADEIVEGAASAVADEAAELARSQRALHWGLDFPEVFAGARPGFDAVVGNPPWEEVTVEELAFYARYRPGLRALAQREREAGLAELREQRPELAGRLDAERERLAGLRRCFAADTGYVGGAGDPDLYKLFCQRYRRLLRVGGGLGVVLPRTALLAKGSRGFRRWLFEETTVRRLDFLLNSGRWAFDAEPRYTYALIAAAAAPAPSGHAVEVAGVADSANAFERQAVLPGPLATRAALGPHLEVPLLPSQEAADLLARLPKVGLFPHGAGHWRCFPVREFDETNDRALWRSGEGAFHVWKGGSFNQYDPHGADARPIPASEAALAKARKPRPGGGSLVAADVPVAVRAAAVAAELGRPRVAFRDVARARDARTIIAALVPPGTFLTNTAPYLAFVDGDDRDCAACLAIMNSLPFDWQARRFVETHVNFFILELLQVPQFDDSEYEQIARAAARLSCPDERFADFAAATGVDCGPLEDDERHELIVEVDALVATAYGLGAGDLEVIFADFSLAALPEEHRDALRTRFAAVSSEEVGPARTA